MIASAASVGGLDGSYTLAYEDNDNMAMLVCFTPSSRGCCYHSNGVVRFLCTAKGGHIADCGGKIERKWRWPSSGDNLANQITFQVMSFFCVNDINLPKIIVLYDDFMILYSLFFTAEYVGIR